jgi:dihydrolipoamide dehydrogenase
LQIISDKTYNFLQEENLMSDYDVIVIGAGPGGYVSAIRASQNGLKTAIVEKEYMGGVCLNVGCIPTKSLLKNADVAHTVRERAREFGISFDNLTLDYAQAVKRSRKVSRRLTKGIAYLMKKNDIDVFMGTARIAAIKQVEITDEDGATQLKTADNIIIATGARPVAPPAWEIDGKTIISYKEAILQETLPESVLIIGAGAIGIEFATVWNAYGSKVTIIEMLPNLLPLEDEESSKELEKAYKKRGIEVLTAHKVEKIGKSGDRAVVTVSGEDGEKTLEAEQALVAIGFSPNSKNLGLDELGVEMDRRGNIQIDDHMHTNVDGIYAIGDVTGKLLLAHTAMSQGLICADHMAGKEVRSLDYRMIPSAVFSFPQVASFGLTEKQAVEEGYEIQIGRFPFSANGKALGLGDSTGFVKIITDKKYGEILGAHMVGPEVSELLPEITLAQTMELTTHEIARNIHTHPTLSEVLLEAAENASGQSIHI